MKRIIAGFICFIMIIALFGCTKQPDGPKNEATAATGTAAVKTDEPAEVKTPDKSSEPTDNPTAVPTAEPTPEPPVNANNIFRTWDDDMKSAFTTLKQTSVEITDEGVLLTYVKGSGAVDPFATFSISSYVKKTGRTALKGSEGSFVVFKVKSSGGDGGFELFTHAPAGGDSSGTSYDPDGQWQYVIVDMTKTTLVKPETLTTMRIDWSAGGTETGAWMLISEIGFFEKLEEAYKYAGIKTEPDENAKRIQKIDVSSDKDGAYCTLEGKNIYVNLEKYASDHGGITEKQQYVAVVFKGELPEGTTVKLTSFTDMAGTVSKVGETAAADSGTGEWQGVLFNIKNFTGRSSVLKKLSLYVSQGTPVIGSIIITDDINEALTACSHSEYCLNTKNVSYTDPLSGTVLKADREDATVSMWFDQTTEKTYRTDTTGTGRSGYTVSMAKNETESAQFFLAPEKDIKVRVSVDEVKDSSGNVIECEVFYEYYHNINGQLVPDALPPLTGPIEISGGTSQGFLVHFTTTKDTQGGQYDTLIHVYDDATGAEIRRAPVSVKVWNITLSDSTNLRTAFGLWESYIYDSYPASDGYNNGDLHRNYYEFFLKYRINIMDVPSGLTSSRGVKYATDERVNTSRWSNDDYGLVEDLGYEPEWEDKVIFYGVDEPDSNEKLANLRKYAEKMKAKNPTCFRMVSPFYCNYDLDASGKIVSSSSASVSQDQIGYMSQYVNIWCPKLDAFTAREADFVADASYLQSKAQDEKYGTFIERMKKEVEEGDELWSYICVSPTEPYANWQLLSDGTEAIVSLWQLKEYDITGLLYWAVDYWKVNYWNNSTPWTGSAYGDGMLIYSGHAFGTPYPIATLRLESVRDGIEDYQMLCMLEELEGREAVDDIISMVTTSVVTYTNDDDYLHAVRVLLCERLEAALEGRQ